jgi:hypothetical protein
MLPLPWSKEDTAVSDPNKPRSTSPKQPRRFQRLDGIAFACILSVPFALALTKPAINANTAILYWVIFVVLAGISINPEFFKSLGELVRYCLIPALSLVLVLSFRGALDYISGAALLTVGTFSSVPANAEWVMKIGFLYAFIFIVTAPAISMASLARRIFLSLGTDIWNAKPAKVKALESNIVIILRILSMLLAAFLAFR